MKLTETKNQYILKGEVECDDCHGTGLYKGMAERGGSAVICWSCKGTGKEIINMSFDKFEKRKQKKDVTRVYETAGAYCITDKDVTSEKDGTTIHFSKYGVAYKDWLKGEKPLPIEELHCPYMHTNQNLQSKDVNGLYKNRCECGLSVGGYISECKHFGDKAKCWEIFNEKR